jgi:hypothetical protein
MKKIFEDATPIDDNLSNLSPDEKVKRLMEVIEEMKHKHSVIEIERNNSIYMNL